MADNNVPNKCNLIINYLPQTLTDDEFFELFESVGKTTYTRIIRDKSSNYSYGYGFVNYDNEADAAKAIEQLNGQNLQHKTIKVAYSQPSGFQTKNINLHVSGLPPHATEEVLRSLAEPFGTVVQCRVIKEKNSGQCQGFGFLLYSSRDEALTAINKLNGQVYEGTSDVLSVKFAKHEQKGPTTSFSRKQQIGRFNNGGMSYRGGGPMRGPAFQGRYSPMAARPMPQPGYYNYAVDYTADGNYFNGGEPGFQGGSSGQEAILFVYGIGPVTDEDMLWHMFSPFGNIVRVNVMWNHVQGTGKGFGFVTFSSFSEASLAVRHMNGVNFRGRVLQVKFKGEAATS